MPRIGGGSPVSRIGGLEPAPGGSGELQSGLAKSPALRALAAGEGEAVREGGNGGAIRKVQHGLRQIGFSLDRQGANGRFTDETRHAVADFQTRHGLPTTGEVDGATLRELDVALTEGAEALAPQLRDGRISRTELRNAEARLTAELGPARGKEALIAALGQDPKAIDFQAIDYLQGSIGSMGGHIESFQKVLVGHLAGAKLVDADFDGRLDKDDLIFTQDASGKVNVRKVGAALRDKVRIGAATVDAAYAMGEAEHAFGKTKANRSFWDYEGVDSGTMFLRRGKSASAAVRDMFENPKKYRFECATAIVTLRYKAILDLLGDEDFDAVMNDSLQIGAWEQEWVMSTSLEAAGRAMKREVAATPSQAAKLRAGDYSYFRNWDVSKSGAKAGWQGENVIYLGDGLYYGHPFGVTDAESIVEHLNEFRKEGSARSASLLDVRARIGRSVLDFDENP